MKCARPGCEHEAEAHARGHIALAVGGQDCLAPGCACSGYVFAMPAVDEPSEVFWVNRRRRAARAWLGRLPVIGWLFR